MDTDNKNTFYYKRNLTFAEDKYTLDKSGPTIMVFCYSKKIAMETAFKEHQEIESDPEKYGVVVNSWIPSTVEDYEEDGKKYSFYGMRIKNKQGFQKRFYLFEV